MYGCRPSDNVAFEDVEPCGSVALGWRFFEACEVSVEILVPAARLFTVWLCRFTAGHLVLHREAQIRFYKLIQFSIEHGLYIAGLVICAMIFDHLVRV